MDNLSAGILPSRKKGDQIPGIIPHRYPLNEVAGFLRNQWPLSTGIPGRIETESVAGFDRIWWPACSGICNQAEDEEFGIEEYRDRVCVIVESDDPGGEPGEFETFLSESLSEWCGFDPNITAQQVETIVGFNPTNQTRYYYEVAAPGEPGAGARGLTDSVTVLLESGNPGGDPGDFGVASENGKNRTLSYTW